MVRAPNFDIVLRVSNKDVRVAKITFSNDGSIYLYFPGLVGVPGLAARCSLPDISKGPGTINLAASGKVTSHMVKYAHHRDGEAHFSQDGKVKTEIRRKSRPLEEYNGHLFTLQAERIHEFREMPPNRKRASTKIIRMGVDTVPETFKIAAFWYSRANRGVTGQVPTSGQIEQDGGHRQNAFFAEPPSGTALADHFLALVPSTPPRMSEDNALGLTFTGGYDEPDKMMSPTADAEILAMMYPCEDFQKLLESLGSIDLA